MAEPKSSNLSTLSSLSGAAFEKELRPDATDLDIEAAAGLDDDEIREDKEDTSDDGSEGKERQRGEKVGAGPACGLGNAVTRSSTKSSWVDPGPPPDGGVRAWTQALLTHVVIMNTWGFINSFGVFQVYYVTAFAKSPSDISWVGSVQVFLIFFIGTFTGRLSDAGHFHALFIVGTTMTIIGLFACSWAKEYYQLFLAQGVCCGIGMGCMFCPALSTLSTYFSRRRGLAIGIAASGSATGGMIFPAMVQQLLPKIGFGWTMRTLGFVQLGLLVAANLGLRQRVPPRKKGALIDYASFKDVPYVLFATGMFFNFLGVYVAFFYLPSFARARIGLSYDSSINLVITLNGVGLPGRLIPNYLADRWTGPFNGLVPVTVAVSVLCFAWIAVDTLAGLYVWAVVYGFTSSAIQSLFPATLSSLTADPRMAGTRMGMVFTVVSFAVLSGPPIAGALVQAQPHGSYLYAQAFGGAVIMIGGLLLAAGRWKLRSKLWVKI